MLKALVGAFNQDMALVGAFSVMTNLRVCGENAIAKLNLFGGRCM